MNMSMITVYIAYPGKEPFPKKINPDGITFGKIVGGHYEVCYPSNNGLAIIYHPTNRESVVPANRYVIDKNGFQRKVLCGTIIFIACDEETSRFREMNKLEEMQLKLDYWEPHFKHYKGSMGLQEGEKLIFTSRHDAVFSAPLQHGPKSMTVIKEYPNFIVVHGNYNTGNGFDFCINKADIMTGASKVKRVSTGEMLQNLL